tara:strand:+ start:632 stop:1003 length:372 start_codon:yes stop_codon:yes gene_type:complete
MGSRSPRGRFGSYLKSVKDRQEKFVPKAPTRSRSPFAGRRERRAEAPEPEAFMDTRPSAGETAFDRDRFNRVARSAIRRDGGRGRARRRFADRMRRRSRRAPGRSSYQTRSRSPFAGRRGRER